MCACICVLAVAGTAASCGKHEEVSSGEVLTDSTWRPIDYTVTSDTYRKWLVAQQALDSIEYDNPVQIDIRHVTDADMDRVAESLRSQPRAAEAIHGAGMSIEDFVRTTVALAQSWELAHGAGADTTGPVAPANADAVRRTDGVREAVRERPRARFLRDNDHGPRKHANPHPKPRAHGKHGGKKGRH